MSQEGGGSFRCILCATGDGVVGEGGSKNQEKMCMELMVGP